MIVRAAERVGIHPALLAANVLSETGNRNRWPGRAQLTTVWIGLDHWHNQQAQQVQDRLDLHFPTQLVTGPGCPP